MKPEFILRAAGLVDQSILERNPAGFWDACIALSDALLNVIEADIATLAALRLGVKQRWWLSRLAWSQEVRSVVYSLPPDALIADIRRRSRQLSECGEELGALLALTALLAPQSLAEVIEVSQITSPAIMATLRHQLLLAYSIFECD